MAKTEASRTKAVVANPTRTSKRFVPKKPKQNPFCVKCGAPIPEERRSDAKFCSPQCGAAAEKARYKSRNPEYVARQNRLTAEWHHKKQHGHTRFLDDPSQNPKDRFRVARSLGYRSMLEVAIARQLEEAGIGFEYEPFKIPYTKPITTITDGNN